MGHGATIRVASPVGDRQLRLLSESFRGQRKADDQPAFLTLTASNDKLQADALPLWLGSPRYRPEENSAVAGPDHKHTACHPAKSLNISPTACPDAAFHGDNGQFPTESCLATKKLPSLRLEAPIRG